MLREAHQICAEEGVGYIPLNHFTSRERKAGINGIPEPTPRGAKVLAKMIQEQVLR